MRIIIFVFLCWTGIFTAVFVLASEKIDINTATQEELIKITHIGNVRALELISLRPFASLDDLIRIRGISKKRVADIKKQALAWASLPTPTQTKEAKIFSFETPSFKPKPSKLPVYLGAGLLASFSGAIILVLKRNLKKNIRYERT